MPTGYAYHPEYLWHDTGTGVEDLPAGIEAARAALDSGAAVGALARLVEVSRREAGQG